MFSFRLISSTIHIGHGRIKYLKVHAVYDAAPAVIGAPICGDAVIETDTREPFTRVEVGVRRLVKYAVDVLENVNELCSLSPFIIQ